MRKRQVATLLLALVAVIAGGVFMASPALAIAAQFQPSTPDQSPGALSVTGFAPSDNLLVGVSLNNAPAGTTFRFTTTTGLTPAYGYSFGSTISEISFTGTQADVNAALASMLVSTGTAEGAFSINLTATLSAANVYYYAPDDHYYKYVSGLITWTSARVAAAAQTLNGATGYLVNITTAPENNFVKQNINAANIWIGGSDAASEGTWKWMDGPEAGTTFWVGTAAGSTVAPFNYASWGTGEPNNNTGVENYAATNWRGTIGLWNDVVSNSADNHGYLVEFSPPAGGFTGVSNTILTAAVGTGTGATSIDAPPPWLQAYGRKQTDVCRSGWHPSWAEWAVERTGGWVCERTVLWSGSSWVQNPNAVWGAMDPGLSTPWDGT